MKYRDQRANWVSLVAFLSGTRDEEKIRSIREHCEKIEARASEGERLVKAGNEFMNAARENRGLSPGDTKILEEVSLERISSSWSGIAEALHESDVLHGQERINVIGGLVTLACLLMQQHNNTEATNKEIDQENVEMVKNIRDAIAGATTPFFKAPERGELIKRLRVVDCTVEALALSMIHQLTMISTGLTTMQAVDKAIERERRNGGDKN